MTEPDPVLVRRISEALDDPLFDYVEDVRNWAMSRTPMQPPSFTEAVDRLARSVAASLGGSVTTEWRVVCADGDQGHISDDVTWLNSSGFDCGPHRVESRQVWHSEWATGSAELPGSR